MLRTLLYNAAGAPVSPRPPAGAYEPTTLVWSHNSAAWVGIVACILLLWVWNSYLRLDKEGNGGEEA